MRHVSIFRRAAAFAIDFALLIAGLYALAVPTYHGVGRAFWDSGAVAGITTLVIIFGYFIVSQTLWGATLGKWLLGLRLRRRDGRQLGAGDVVMRYLLRAANGLTWHLTGLVLALLAARYRRVAELLTGTVVVRVSRW